MMHLVVSYRRGTYRVRWAGVLILGAVMGWSVVALVAYGETLIAGGVVEWVEVADLGELLLVLVMAGGATLSALALQIMCTWTAIRSFSKTLMLVLGPERLCPTVPLHWPTGDIDVTTTTDAEDLIVFLGDVVEFVGQDAVLLADVCGEVLLGGGAAGITLAAIQRLLSTRRVRM